MSEKIDFDDLAKKAFAENSTMKDKDRLWKAAFSLPKWNFIARGEFPDIHPYTAGREDVEEGKYMIRAFTDTDRLYRFAGENDILDDGKGSLILSIPTDSIIQYLEGYVQHGAYGLWFNSDLKSHSFYSPLVQLRPIKNHLDSHSQNS